ncbi:MAG TPA: zinc-binding dehydrogenase, partial [Pirellulaceae bacterium]|nr:zinc-binding dehydrogenase [Pirellulaceae bacterium]
FAEYAAVPDEWLVPLPDGLSAFEAAAIGTAGYTAAQCCQALLAHGVTPSSGPIVVSGATGGVGIFAVKLLRHLGYQVVASSGKPDRRDWLISHGADEVISREALQDTSAKPMLSVKWGGAVDTVGGLCLSTILRQTRPRGCVAACGLVGGAELPMTVYPFILRGVVLAGIDSAGVTNAERRQLWQRMASDWKFTGLTDITRLIGLPDLPTELENIRAGRVAGRVVVDLHTSK